MNTCPKCGAEVAIADQYCGSCGADMHLELQIDAMYTPALETARKWIFAVGIIYVVSALLMGAMSGDMTNELLWGPTIALFVCHLGLWWWAKTQPFPAAVVALVLFVTVQGINAALDPETIYQGLIVKVLFLVALIKAVQAGSQANRLRRQVRSS